MTRDPSRIDPILARLRAAWLAHPDMRLGQLVENAVSVSPKRRGNGPPTFYAEDEHTEAGLDYLAGHPSMPARKDEQ